MKKFITVLSLILVAGLALLVLVNIRQKTEPIQTGRTYHAPTLFVHGYGGNYGSEKNMIAALSQHSEFKQVLKYTIAPDGKLTTSGTWDPDIKYPIIAIVFKDGKPNDSQLNQVLIDLKKDYKISSFNAVGHSAGANAWVNWTVTADKDKTPELARLVTLASPFNGFRGMGGQHDGKPLTLDKDGKPSFMVDFYQAMYENRAYFPENTRILNLFGDIGDGSDGVVPINSSRSLHYLVESKAKSYTEKKITNNKAQHSKLHQRNPLVDQYLYDFLTGDLQ